MDPVILSRLQFALTIGFHYIFPPVTIGLAWLIVWFMTKYARTGEKNLEDEIYYRATTRFWLKLFTLTFAVGVATGLTMAFQFGTNWSGYSRFVGDVFGPPLALEAISAFFLESTFLAILIAGWDRVSKRTLWFSSLMVAIGSTLSGLWILIANSWMHTPKGYKPVYENDELVKVELTSFWKAALNPSSVPRFLHTIDGALITGAFFMVGVSAFYILKGENKRFAKECMKVALIVAFLTSLAQPMIGHYHAVQVAETQPEKFATYELIEGDGTGAPMPLFAILDPSSEEPIFRIDVPFPDALGIVFFFDPNHDFQSLDELEDEGWPLPPQSLTFYPFHLMIALGFLFILMSGLGLFLLKNDRLYNESKVSKLYLFASILCIPLPFIANELGWIATEVGRQPWIVYRLLRTEDAISPNVAAGEILFSIILFTSIYILLFFLWMFLLIREIHRGPEMPTQIKNEGI